MEMEIRFPRVDMLCDDDADPDRFFQIRLPSLLYLKCHHRFLDPFPAPNQYHEASPGNGK